MESRRDEIATAALSLPAGERARLAERLTASLPEDPEIERVWMLEVRGRLERYRAGGIESVLADEVFEKARDRLRG